MWADDLEIVESCGFDLSLSYFDSINSIGVFAATDTFAHMKGPTIPPVVWKHNHNRRIKIMTIVSYICRKAY